MCPQAVAGRAGAQMTVEREMFRSELPERESGLRVSVVSRVTDFFPLACWSAGVVECCGSGFLTTPLLLFSITESLPQDDDAVPAPPQCSLN